MNVLELSDQSLCDLHALIAECLRKDDAVSGPKPWGVRQHPDWKKQTDDFETELTKRGLGFTPIKW